MHWTYAPSTGADLEQGDILKLTPALQALLDEVHPHFADAKYVGFMVTTQSCDLVRRPDPKTGYINIASIRSLKEIGSKLLKTVAKSFDGRILYSSDKGRAIELFRKIFNQNHQSLGLFYLHPEMEFGLGDPSVAFLRVTVSLKAEHYDMLTSARVGALSSEFRAKFGWLLGNLYSRAATQDWKDTPEGATTLDLLLDRYAINPEGIKWVDDNLIESAERKGAAIHEQPLDTVLDFLKQYEPPSSLRLLEQQVTRPLQSLLSDHSPVWKTIDSTLDRLIETVRGVDSDGVDAKREAVEAIKAALRDHLATLPARVTKQGPVKSLLR